MDHDILTAERLRELLRYDPETGIFTRRVDRPKARAGAVAGTPNSGGYLVIKIDGKQYKAHRLAWLYVYGKWPDYTIDHINGIRTDNRMVNLRDVPIAINNQNLHAAHRDSASGVIGVQPLGQRFRALIRINKKQIFLGVFNTPEEAHAAYLEAKRRIHVGCTI